MKRHAFPALLLLAALLVTPPLTAGKGARPSDPPCDGLTSYLATLPAEPLSDVERAGLLYTREEEKLARDVYVAMASKWGHRVFTNIAAAEQQHMDAVLLLLGRYDLADPAKDLAPGVFANERLQSLYVSLVGKGNLSLVDAFAVGATIEDLDLADVGELLEDADNVDVDTLMQNLAKGSRNHLRSFVSLLTAAGGTYEPVYLGVEEYEEIVSTPLERRVVYDAAGLPVEGFPVGACDGAGPGNGPGAGEGPGGNGSCSGPGPGTGGGTGTGNPGGNGNGGGGRP